MGKNCIKDDHECDDNLEVNDKHDEQFQLQFCVLRHYKNN